MLKLKEQTTKFLDIIISENLSWDEHIKIVSGKINKVAEVICRLIGPDISSY